MRRIINSIHQYKAVLFFEQDIPIACGAIKEIDDHVEIKRMFIHPSYRGKGLSRLMLSALEKLGKKLAYQYALLETGIKLVKAVNLY
ncbi:MAG: putative acetyltransferase [Saprospiraceae bacterium]|jgi:putative acetyltransferase